MRFTVTELPLPHERGSWKELYRIPLDMFVAIFWLTPKAVIKELFGKDAHDDHHDEPIDDSPGWQRMGHGWPVGLERFYFEAETTFNDMAWHAVDGYRFRLQAPFPELEALYFEGKNIYPVEVGFVGQALAVEGDDHDCPILFINTHEKTITRLLDLGSVALVSFSKQEIAVRTPKKRWAIAMHHD